MYCISILEVPRESTNHLQVARVFRRYRMCFARWQGKAPSLHSRVAFVALYHPPPPCARLLHSVLFAVLMLVLALAASWLVYGHTCWQRRKNPAGDPFPRAVVPERGEQPRADVGLLGEGARVGPRKREEGDELRL